MQTPAPAPKPTEAGQPPEKVDLSQESVAGEEDPGASLDVPPQPLPAPPKPPPRSG